MTKNTNVSDEIRQLGHEPDRFSVPLVLATGAGLAVTVGLAFWLILVMFEDFAARGQPPEQIPASLQQAIQPPTEPALSPYQPQQLQQMRAAENAVLTSYAWIDEKEGVARIPIDRAIDILTEMDRKARGAGQQNKESKPNSNSTETDVR